MTKSTHIVFLGCLAALAIAAVLAFAPGSQPGTLGGYIAPSVSATNVTVGTASTTIYATNSNLQRLVLTNLGPGVIYCAFGTTPVVKNGMHVNPLGSSTDTRVDITDQNLLTKRMSCIGTSAASSSILKYANY
jgi:hypothetical protein